MSNSEGVSDSPVVYEAVENPPEVVRSSTGSTGSDIIAATSVGVANVTDSETIVQEKCPALRLKDGIRTFIGIDTQNIVRIENLLNFLIQTLDNERRMAEIANSKDCNIEESFELSPIEVDPYMEDEVAVMGISEQKGTALIQRIESIRKKILTMSDEKKLNYEKAVAIIAKLIMEEKISEAFDFLTLTPELIEERKGIEQNLEQYKERLLEGLQAFGNDVLNLEETLRQKALKKREDNPEMCKRETWRMSDGSDDVEKGFEYAQPHHKPLEEIKAGVFDFISLDNNVTKPNGRLGLLRSQLSALSEEIERIRSYKDLDAQIVKYLREGGCIDYLTRFKFLLDGPLSEDEDCRYIIKSTDSLLALLKEIGFEIVIPKAGSRYFVDKKADQSGEVACSPEDGSYVTLSNSFVGINPAQTKWRWLAERFLHFESLWRHDKSHEFSHILPEDRITVCGVRSAGKVMRFRGTSVKPVINLLNPVDWNSAPPGPDFSPADDLISDFERNGQYYY